MKKTTDQEPQRMTSKFAKSLLRLAWKDNRRPGLQGFHVEDGRVIVTDTHRLYISGDPAKTRSIDRQVSSKRRSNRGTTQGGATYSRESIKLEVEACKTDKRDFDFDNCNKIDERFPAWFRVIPSGEKHKVAFDVKYLRDICDLAVKSGIDSGGKIVMRMTTASRPATFEWTSEDGGGHTVVLMPMAMEDKP